ncbi:MAG: glycosyltransferase, partial [Duncaniella sp.]|nr:glycosyltransferase [Duncaniella sp.]
MKENPRFSVIVPVYNRVDEVRDLLESLSAQTCKNFETVIVEDGSTEPCGHLAEEYPEANVSYYFKPNEGRSIARNHGMERARGEYFIFFDSDCVIPPRYFETITEALDRRPLDCFGGPDAAHESFTPTQKAINFAMTSFLTTGGIRGGKVSMEKFVPRTFNMGFSRRVYDKVGGFREMFSEDIDMSTRIREAGFSIGLIHEAPVYHKRRVDFKRFFRQVHVFGMSRITLKLLYPGSLKAVHALPALAVIIGLALVLLAIFVSLWW